MTKKKEKHEIGKNIAHAYDVAVIANAVIHRVSGDGEKLTEYESALLRGWLIEIEDALQNATLAIMDAVNQKTTE